MKQPYKEADMARILNISWSAVIIATLVFFAIGFVWYGFLFEAQWLASEGITQADAEARMEDTGMDKWLFFALLITFAQAIGVLMVLHPAGAKRLTASLKAAFWLVITVVLPVLTYACVYSGYSLSGYMIDFGHMALGYLAMAAVYVGFRGKNKSAHRRYSIDWRPLESP